MTQQTDVVQQAVGYCRHQAEKGIDSLAALMERTGGDWQRCLEGMSEVQASFAPGSEWSASQVWNHFLGVTSGANRQIERLTAGADPTVALDDEAALAAEAKPPSAETVPEARAALSGLFAEIVSITLGLEGNQYLNRQFPHPMFGQLNILEWIAFQRIHSMDHMQQIDKNKADPAYPKA